MGAGQNENFKTDAVAEDFIAAFGAAMIVREGTGHNRRHMEALT
jgi:hypothetical protein